MESGEEAAEAQELLDLLDPRGRGFGSDTADLVSLAVEHGALTLSRPVVGVRIEPTVVAESRDGGLLVLVDIAATGTLASARVGPEQLDDGVVGEQVLSLVAETVCGVYERACAGWGRW